MAGYLSSSPARVRSWRGITAPRATLAPLPLRTHEKIVFGSDSITSGYGGALSWPTGTGNFIDQVNAILGVGNEVIATENGQPGSGIDYLLAHLSTMIFAPDPTFVILYVGVNDAATGTANFFDKYVSCLAQIRAWKPTVKIACIGVGPYQSENWSLDSNGKPAWNLAQASLETYEAYVRLAATAMDCPFVNWRQRLLAWEVTNNPGGGSLGFATIDGTHFNDAGQKQLAAAVLSVCNVFP